MSSSGMSSMPSSSSSWSTSYAMGLIPPSSSSTKSSHAATSAASGVATSPTACPGGHNTNFTDNAGHTYTLYCDYDTTASSYNHTYVALGDMNSCTNLCDSNGANCGSASLTGQDCYSKPPGGNLIQSSGVQVAVRVGTGLSLPTSSTSSSDPLCGTNFTDPSGATYQVMCGLDTSAASIQVWPVQSGGYKQCFGACDQDLGCGGFTFSGSDRGTCYLKASPGSYTTGSNVVSAFKVNTTGSGSGSSSMSMMPSSAVLVSLASSASAAAQSGSSASLAGYGQSSAVSASAMPSSL